jgi:signal recognition particle receptor subunit beta
VPGGPTTLFVDNLATIDFTTRERMSDKGYKLDHKYLKIRELVADNKLRLTYVSSMENIADALSKPLNRPRFLLLTDRMSISS